MSTQVMKWVSITALLLAAVGWNSVANYERELYFVVSVAAAVVVVQAVQAKRYGCAAGFLATALLYHPAAPVLRLAGDLSRSLFVLSIAPFAVSVFVLRPHPLMPVPLITGRTPGSQSL